MRTRTSGNCGVTMTWTSDALSGPGFRVATSDPSDEEVVDLVKLWGDAAGLLDVAGGRVGAAWTMYAGERGLIIHHADCLNKWMGDSDTLLVWALAVISGRAVDVGKCPRCHGDGHTARLVLDAAPREGMFRLEVHPGVVSGSWHIFSGGRAISEPFSSWSDETVRNICEGLVRALHPRTNARVVDGQAVEFDADAAVTVESPDGSATISCTGWRSGDPKAIDHLAVWSSQWESDGDPLGATVSNWLRQMELGERIEGWRGVALAGVLAAWERLTVPCERCEETGKITIHRTPVPGARGNTAYAVLELPGPGPGRRAQACPDCGGSRRVKPRGCTDSPAA
jgi:hypothetical protein